MFFLPKDSDSDIIEILNEYMFVKRHILSDASEPSLPIQSIKETILELPIINQPILETKLPPIIEFFSPTHQDSLFWCIYIAIHGFNDYQQVSRNYGVKELEIKQKIGNWIQSNQNKMKHTNIKITKASVQEILSELLTSVRETSFLSMIGMIVFFNINILIVDTTGKKMIEFLSEVGNQWPTYVLHKDNFGKYKLQAEPVSKPEIEKMKATIYCLESYLKPLKPISSYHVEDLYNIAKKIGIYNENKKYKKTDLYQELNENLNWK